MPSAGQNSDQYLPAMIGRFRILRLLGMGAMSKVYLAFDTYHQKQIAIKVLADHLAGNKQFINRFYREAMMSMRFKHDRIIAGYESGYDHGLGKHYLTMEYIQGKTTADILQESGPLPLEKVIKIGKEICRGLHELHRQGFVHRDVKPENIILDQQDLPKLIDLGLVKRIDGDSELTATNQGVGTPQYMPYEQSVNGELVDERSDIFALAASLYHLVSGHLPFLGISHEEMTKEKELNAYLPLTKTAPALPELFDSVLAKALARDPRARYATVYDFVAALNCIPIQGSSSVDTQQQTEARDHDTKYDLKKS